MSVGRCAVVGCMRSLHGSTYCGPHYERVRNCGDPLPSVPIGGMPRRRRPVPERFWSKVDRSAGPGGCWPWTAARHPKGYGLFHTELRPDTSTHNTHAHRVAWELTNGPIPLGQWALHRCDNPPCCNPSHLFLGSNEDNVADRQRKGRGKPPPDRWALARAQQAAAGPDAWQDNELRFAWGDR